MTILTTSTETDQVFSAFLKAQCEFLHVRKEGTVPLTKSGLSGPTASFATFPDVIEHVKPILNKHGLTFTQLGMDAVGGVRVSTVIMHGESGQFFHGGGTFIPAAKTDPMGYGSAQSFAKRYDLLSTLGVATDDDDGAAAFAGFEREAKQRAEAVAAAANRITPEQVSVLVAVAKRVSPSSDEARLEARYQDVLKEDFASTLEAGLQHAAKAEAIDAATAEDIATAALAGDTNAALTLMDVAA